MSGPESGWRAFLRSSKRTAKLYAKSKIGVLGAAVIVFFILMAIFAPYLTSNNPVFGFNVGAPYSVPAWATLLPEYKNTPVTYTPVQSALANQGDLSGWKTSYQNDSMGFINGSLLVKGTIVPNQTIMDDYLAGHPDNPYLPGGQVFFSISKQFKYTQTAPYSFEIETAIDPLMIANVSAIYINFTISTPTKNFSLASVENDEIGPEITLMPDNGTMVRLDNVTEVQVANGTMVRLGDGTVVQLDNEIIVQTCPSTTTTTTTSTNTSTTPPTSTTTTKTSTSKSTTKPHCTPPPPIVRGYWAQLDSGTLVQQSDGTNIPLCGATVQLWNNETEVRLNNGTVVEPKVQLANETVADQLNNCSHYSTLSDGEWVPVSDNLTPVSVTSFDIGAGYLPTFPSTSNPSALVFASKGTYTLTMQVQAVPVANTTSVSMLVSGVSFKVVGGAYGLLGTDSYGRDVWSQLVYGSRVSLEIGVLAGVGAVLLGTLFGMVAGYLGGFADEVFGRITDFFLVIPFLPLLIVLLTILGENAVLYKSIYDWVILIFVILSWPYIERLIRSQVLSVKERPYVEASRAVGGGTWHVIRKHILPNVMGLVYSQIALNVSGFILLEAALDYLAVSVHPIRTITWGLMLSSALPDAVSNATKSYVWWWFFPPGICIAAVSLAFVLVGFALDSVFNPKLRAR